MNAGMNCDLIAPHYWWIERLGMGNTLERRRRWFLPEIGNARRALVLGDGDGRFLAELLRWNLAVRADYVDLSGRMLELARAKAGADRVRYMQGDARKLEFARGEYDLITTHFFFDCFGPDFEGVTPHTLANKVDSYYVLEGEAEFSVEGETFVAGPGSYVSAPIGVSHGFRNAGGGELRLLNVHAPNTGFAQRLREG